jgi:hypothetical protein
LAKLAFATDYEAWFKYLKGEETIQSCLYVKLGVSILLFFFMSFESWPLDQCFLFFHFLILKFSQNCLFFVPKFAIGLEIKIICHLNLFQHKSYCIFIVLAYQGKDIVFRFIMEYS